MLFSKWVLAAKEDYTELKKLPVKPFFCLDFRYAAGDMPALYRLAQEMNDAGTFSLLLSEKSPGTSQEHEIGTCLDALITLFFQPSFYIVDNSPVIFIKPGINDQITVLAEELRKKCQLQGFTNLITLCPANIANNQGTNEALNYWIEDRIPDPGTTIENWMKRYLKNRNFSPVHCIITGGNIHNKLTNFNFFLHQELLLSRTMNYTIATRFRELQTDIHVLGQKLQEQKINEDNLQRYLEIQKKDLAKALDWYHYEHEILPLWYKRFGHIIKVLMGKRSFRSLFNDNVKKYKD